MCSGVKIERRWIVPWGGSWEIEGNVLLFDILPRRGPAPPASPRLALPAAWGAHQPVCHVADSRVPAAAPAASYLSACILPCPPSTPWGAAPHPLTPRLTPSMLLMFFSSPLVMLHNSFYQLSVAKCLF